MLRWLGNNQPLQTAYSGEGFHVEPEYAAYVMGLQLSVSALILRPSSSGLLTTNPAAFTTDCVTEESLYLECGYMF